MELRHMQQVLEVCRSGGFTVAARRLRISQPTLSKSIARLEEQLNVKLFERHQGAARPTPYGVFVAERAESILQDADALTRDLRNLVRGETGRLRIAVGPATRLKPLPEFMHLLSEQFPKLLVQTVQETGAGVAQVLSQGQVEIAFTFSEYAADYADFVRKKLFEDPIVFVARPGHPLVGRSKLSPREVLQHPVGLPGVTPGLRAWAGQLSRAEADNFTALVSHDYDLIIKHAMRTDLMTVGARFLFKEQLERGQLVELDTTLDVVYTCWMLTTRTLWRSPIIKIAAKLAKAAANAPTRGDAG